MVEEEKYPKVMYNDCLGVYAIQLNETQYLGEERRGDIVHIRFYLHPISSYIQRDWKFIDSVQNIIDSVPVSLGDELRFEDSATCYKVWAKLDSEWKEDAKRKRIADSIKKCSKLYHDPRTRVF